jgi:2-polyprenyl-6-hydroxyphenyl methylase/3-demethylubiquinone-9 3-methyltransferase
VSKGIEKNRVYTEGKGEKQPVADNKTKEGRAKNRRVEIEVVGTRANKYPSADCREKPRKRGFFYGRLPEIRPMSTQPSTSIRPNWPNSPTWPTAGGTRKASSVPCTKSIRCGWTGSTAWHRCTGQRVLDVGCGGGILADAMARKGAEVLGIDLATKSLRVAQLHALEAGHPRCSTAKSAWKPWPPNNPAASMVTCMEMLEHVPDPASVVRPAPAGQAGRLGVLLHHQPQPEGLHAGHRGGGIRAQHVAQRHARIRPLIRPSELAAYCRAAHNWTCSQTTWAGIQPDDAALLVERTPASTTCLPPSPA